MGFPSGTFSSTYSGKLQVSFSGQFSASGGVDLGGPRPAGSPDIRIKCWVGSLLTIISFDTMSNVIEVDYTAGTSVPVSMEFGSRTFGGSLTVTASNLRIRCILMKR